MNIAAVMAALEVHELDRTAKQVVVILACRADMSGAARVSIERIANDCEVSYGTAWRALQRAMSAGYITAETVGRNGRSWHLSSRVHARAVRAFATPEIARLRPNGRAPTRTEGSLRRKEKDGDAVPLTLRANGVAYVVDDPAPSGPLYDSLVKIARASAEAKGELWDG
jgi:hypothetical protein